MQFYLPINIKIKLGQKSGPKFDFVSPTRPDPITKAKKLGPARPDPTRSTRQKARPDPKPENFQPDHPLTRTQNTILYVKKKLSIKAEDNNFYHSMLLPNSTTINELLSSIVNSKIITRKMNSFSKSENHIGKYYYHQSIIRTNF